MKGYERLLSLIVSLELRVAELESRLDATEEYQMEQNEHETDETAP